MEKGVNMLKLHIHIYSEDDMDGASVLDVDAEYIDTYDDGPEDDVAYNQYGCGFKCEQCKHNYWIEIRDFFRMGKSKS